MANPQGPGPSIGEDPQCGQSNHTGWGSSSPGAHYSSGIPRMEVVEDDFNLLHWGETLPSDSRYILEDADTVSLLCRTFYKMSN